MSSRAIILSRLESFDGFEQAPRLNGLHAEQLGEPEFFA